MARSWLMLAPGPQAPARAVPHECHGNGEPHDSQRLGLVALVRTVIASVQAIVGGVTVRDNPRSSPGREESCDADADGAEQAEVRYPRNGHGPP